MEANPSKKPITISVATGNIENHALATFDRRIELVPVQQEKGLQRSVTDPLVPIDECMIADEGERQSRSLGGQIRVEIHTCEGRPRLSNRRLQRTKIAQRRDSTREFGDSPMQLKHLGQGQIPHEDGSWLRESPVQLRVLLENAVGRSLKIAFAAGEKIPERSSSQRLRRNLEPFSHAVEMRLLRFGDFDGEAHSGNLVAQT